MGKYNISAKTFNSMTINPIVEMFIDGTIKFNQTVKNKQLLSTQVYSSVQTSVLKTLSDIFPKLSIDSVGFQIISRDFLKAA